MRIFAFSTDEQADGALHVSMTGELDHDSKDRLNEELERIEEGRPALIVLDLRGLTFIDSTGLGTVVAADERARRDGRRLVLVQGPEAVSRVFETTGLDSRLEFVADPSALASAG